MKKKRKVKKQGRSNALIPPPPVPKPSRFSTPELNQYVSSNPFAELTEGDVREFFLQWGTKAQADFTDLWSALENTVRNHNPLELLATASYHTLLKSVGPDTDFKDSGPYSQAVLELLQSICLRYPISSFGTHPVLHQHLFTVLDQLNTCSKRFAEARYVDLAGATKDTKHLRLLIEGARLHTQGLRNWGYPQHMYLILQELLAPLDDDSVRDLGFPLTGLLRLTKVIFDIVSSRATLLRRSLAHAFSRNTVAGMLDECCRILGAPIQDRDANLESLRSRPSSQLQRRLFLLSFFHQFLPDCFVFSHDELLAAPPSSMDPCTLTRLLDELCLRFGELASSPTGHLVMQSPIRTKPVIKLDDGRYFVPLPGLLHSFMSEIVDTWMTKNAALRTKYLKRRARFLEDRLTKMAAAAFPDFLVASGVYWTDPSNNKTYESDCLAVVGPFALIFEGKSERVDDSARRGGEKRLVDNLAGLIDEPAEQAQRFAEFLETGEGTTSFKTRGNGEIIVDLSNIHRAVCVSITLDWLPATVICWKDLVAAGVVPPTRRPAVNMSLADLLVVLDVLNSPTLRLHYLLRRVEWESNVSYWGDEEDLLVYYLSNGLDSQRREGPFMLYGNSDHLHNYYMPEWVDKNVSVPKPMRMLTDWWTAIIKRVERMDKPHKWDILCILLDVPFRDQKTFESRLRAIKRRSGRKRQPKGEDGLIFVTPPTGAKGAVVGIAYSKVSIDVRNDRAANLAEQALQNERVDRVVVIGFDAESAREPYSFLGYWKR